MLLLMLLTTELMLVTVNLFILLLHVNALFHCIIIDYNINSSLLLLLTIIRGDKTHPLIFIVGTNNFIEYLPRYQLLQIPC